MEHYFIRYNFKGFQHTLFNTLVAKDASKNTRESELDYILNLKLSLSHLNKHNMAIKSQYNMDGEYL